jgi:hypothetical protein
VQLVGGREPSVLLTVKVRLASGFSSKPATIVLVSASTAEYLPISTVPAWANAEAKKAIDTINNFMRFPLLLLLVFFIYTSFFQTERAKTLIMIFDIGQKQNSAPPCGGAVKNRINTGNI